MSHPRQGWPDEPRYYLCNRELSFSDANYHIHISFPQALPPGAARPSFFLFAHDECARRAADPSYELPVGPEHFA